MQAGFWPSGAMSTKRTPRASPFSSPASASIFSALVATITGSSFATPSRMKGSVRARKSSAPA